MSEDIAPAALGQLQIKKPPGSEELVAHARNAIDTSGGGGVTLDLGHTQINQLPEEVIDIIQHEIERLAIYHNRVSSFPMKLASCKKLRYLNARFNQFKEFPRAVLSLPSLEILDLSRNKLKVIPDGIKNMKSLKVLAIQGNRIERLPLCLGNMSSLRVLKVDGNPLVFPPAKICMMDEDEQAGVMGAGERALVPAAAITQRIKAYLREYGAPPNGNARTPRAIDSDGELSEGNAETPRPFRPAGTRFPVRPSISGIDGMVALSTSPEPLHLPSIPPAPPIPTRSHERIRSNQTPINTSQSSQSLSSLPSQHRKPALLSPPDSSMSLLPQQNAYSDPANNVTLRPKRHGLITPRGPEGAAQQLALSPSALQEAFSNLGSFPSSRPTSRGSNRSSPSLPDPTVEVARLCQAVMFEQCARLDSLRSLIEMQNHPNLKAQIELECRAASARVQSLRSLLPRGPKDTTSSSQRQVRQAAMDCLASFVSISRLLSQSAAIYCRNCTSESFRNSFWNANKDRWEFHVAALRSKGARQSAMHSRQTSNSIHSRQTSSSSQYKLPFPILDPGRSQGLSYDPHFPPPSRSGFAPSPTSTAYSAAPASTNTSFSSSMLSPIPSTSTISFGQASSEGSYNVYPLRQDELRQEMANDPLWEDVYRYLQAVCERSNEGLPRMLQHLSAEQEKIRKGPPYYDKEEHIKQVESLLSRVNTLIACSTALTRRLENLRITDRAIRHSVEFWSFPRNLFLEWSGFMDKAKQLGKMGISGVHSPEIKPYMKDIHHAVKKASSHISTKTPWSHYFNSSIHSSSNISNEGAAYAMRPLPNPSAINIPNHPLHVGSIPSTPLSAALGPAAAAVQGKTGSSRAINFFERADRFNGSVAGREGLYGKR